ncbi:HAD hydrolase-like protein [Lacticaseibacillus camelliae]|uniref:HAD hydrolase-like protein n=1 Tax=Lacticaseibacillus camelliae TaxID=381742 RepID=UPI000A5E1286|nr:HAD hydrolase-like protein [Lacticaseibacillus camelliae]
MKTLFFDLDGTIADSQEGIINSIHYMIQKQHLPLLDDDTYRQFIGPSLGSSLNKYYPALSAAEVDQTIQYYHEFYLAKGIFQQTLYPGILDALDRLLHAGYQLNIASAKPEPMVTQIAERFAEPLLYWAVRRHDGRAGALLQNSGTGIRTTGKWCGPPAVVDDWRP